MTHRIDMQLLNPSPRVNARVGEALYTDLNALKGLNNGDKSPESLRAVAQQFESIFVKMMLDSMRDANAVFAEGNYLDNSETDFYQDMMDNQLSVSLSEGKGIGLADVIFEQLSRYNSRPQRVDNIDQSVLLRSSDASRPQVEQLSLNNQSKHPPTSEPFQFEDPEAFVESLLPMAAKIGRQMGVDHRALLAQAALETGWGKFISQASDGKSSYNLFNIKADHRWQGDTVSISTLEYRDGVAVRERAAFRAYNSFEESFQDYLQFISESPRYQPAIKVGSDGEQYIKLLHEAGYATDPAYAKKVSQIMASETLAKDRSA